MEEENIDFGNHSRASSNRNSIDQDRSELKLLPNHLDDDQDYG